MLRFPLPLVALTFVAALVAASHAPMGRCDAQGAPALGLIEFTGGTPETSFYVDDRSWALGNGLWIYEESNGVWVEKHAGVHNGDATRHSLQRGGCSGLLAYCGGYIPNDNDICVDTWDLTPDLRVLW